MSETIDTNSLERQATTAAYLLAFRKELLDGEMPAHVVDDLVADASRHLVSNDGLCVKRQEPANV